MTTEITKEERREQIKEVREQLKEKVAEQVEDKAILRKPHVDYMGDFMLSVMYRAADITELHQKLNELCGKPNSHQYKER